MERPLLCKKKSRSSTHRDTTAAASGSSYRPCLEFLIICVLCLFLSLRDILNKKSAKNESKKAPDIPKLIVKTLSNI